MISSLEFCCFLPKLQLVDVIVAASGSVCAEHSDDDEEDADPDDSDGDGDFGLYPVPLLVMLVVLVTADVDEDFLEKSFVITLGLDLGCCCCWIGIIGC